MYNWRRMKKELHSERLEELREATNDIARKREELKRIPKYKGSIGWLIKVENFPPAQVLAVHARCVKDNMWDEELHPPTKPNDISFSKPEIKKEKINDGEQVEMDLALFN